MSAKFQVEFNRQIAEIPREEWQAVVNTDYPFIQYEFLLALESSGAVTAETGWQPCHLTVRDKAQLVAVVPLYLKNHSYGEYVFDFQWANAFHQAGHDYYPKLVSAIPFTPVSGRRIYSSPTLANYPQKIDELYTIIVNSIIEFAKQNRCSSWHILFPTEAESGRLQASQLMSRVGMQYHWMNRDYQSFEQFLSGCKLKKRKNIKRERLGVIDSGVHIDVVSGDELDENDWKRFYLFYQLTYAKRSGHGGYLNEAFFQQLGRTMCGQIVMVRAFFEQQMVAASLMFKDRNCLYGRYWGCLQEIEFLHFELCYYQGIDYCIAHGLQRFDAGAQGEHKIARGFEPQQTYSNHWIADPAFSEAIAHYLQQEARHVRQEILLATSGLPFKINSE